MRQSMKPISGHRHVHEVLLERHFLLLTFMEFHSQCYIAVFRRGDLKANVRATKKMEEKPLEKKNLVGWQKITVQVIVSLVPSSNHLENTVEKGCHSKRYPIITYPRTET